MSINSDCPFYCFICCEIIISEEGKYLHFEQHVNYNRFKCLECDSQYSTYDNLKCHQQCFKHFDFQKTTNIGVRKLITSLMELSSKIVASADMDSVKFLLTVETEKNKTGNPESDISNDSEENTIDNGRAKDKSLVSNINTEVINSINVEKDDGKFKALTLFYN
uniref:C2H2-type domain-containing protein n=1 Tax=Strongyloides papillosus TaxID=174720 RepID=A0A0N5BA12_STREA